jgi:hypothetical protein
VVVSSARHCSSWSTSTSRLMRLDARPQEGESDRDVYSSPSGGEAERLCVRMVGCWLSLRGWLVFPGDRRSSSSDSLESSPPRPATSVGCCRDAIRASFIGDRSGTWSMSSGSASWDLVRFAVKGLCKDIVNKHQSRRKSVGERDDD